MPWIVISNKPRLGQRLAHLTERSFPDSEQCVNEGGGVYETRAEMLTKYKPARVFVKRHPDGIRVAVWMNAAAKARYDARRAAIQAKRTAGTADAEEVEIAELPSDVPALDATWDAPVVPPGA